MSFARFSKHKNLFILCTLQKYTHTFLNVYLKLKTRFFLAVHCPMPTPMRRGLAISNQNNKMNAHITFKCESNHSLIGAPEITCLPSGNWSAPFPVCESTYTAKSDLRDYN